MHLAQFRRTCRGATRRDGPDGHVTTGLNADIHRILPVQTVSKASAMLQAAEILKRLSRLARQDGSEDLAANYEARLKALLATPVPK